MEMSRGKPGPYMPRRHRSITLKQAMKKKSRETPEPSIGSTIRLGDYGPKGRLSGVHFGVITRGGLGYDPAIAFSYYVRRRLRIPDRNPNYTPGIVKRINPKTGAVAYIDPFTRKPIEAN